MSNESLTIEEVSNIIRELNGDFSDKVYDECKYEDYFELFTVESQGFMIVVKCLGTCIWNDEDDCRAYLDNEESEVLFTPSGEEAKEDFKECLIKEFKKIVEMVNLFGEGL